MLSYFKQPFILKRIKESLNLKLEEDNIYSLLKQIKQKWLKDLLIVQMVIKYKKSKLKKELLPKSQLNEQPI